MHNIEQSERSRSKSHGFDITRVKGAAEKKHRPTATKQQHQQT